LSCLRTKFFWCLSRSKYLLWWGSCICVKSVTTCIKCFFVSGKAESSWFGNRIFGSCVVYFGLLLRVILCIGILLVVLCTTIWYVQKLSVWKLLYLFVASAPYLPLHRWYLHSTDLYFLLFPLWVLSQGIFWHRIKRFESKSSFLPANYWQGEFYLYDRYIILLPRYMS